MMAAARTPPASLLPLLAAAAAARGGTAPTNLEPKANPAAVGLLPENLRGCVGVAGRAGAPGRRQSITAMLLRRANARDRHATAYPPKPPPPPCAASASAALAELKCCGLLPLPILRPQSIVGREV